MQRCLFNLHRRLLPIDVIRSKAQEYVGAGLADEQSAHAMVRTDFEHPPLLRFDGSSDAEIDRNSYAT